MTEEQRRPIRSRTRRRAERALAGHWRAAAVKTFVLWTCLILLYLPIIVIRDGGEIEHVAADSASILYSMLLGMGLFAFFRATLPLRPRLRVPLLGLAVFLSAMVNLGTDIAYNHYVEQAINPAWLPGTPQLPHAYTLLLIYLLVFSANLALFQHSAVVRRRLRDERRLTAARMMAQQAQLEALRLQLNPHFLFNTLNAISGLIVTGRAAEADQMIDRLSSFLRAVIAQNPTQRIPLDEELALIEDYLHIEQARFGERLDVRIDRDAAAAAVPIPALLLQPLVENAIKYGVSPSRDPVCLRIGAAISAGELVVRVSDDGQPAAADHARQTKSTGIGLRNVRQRLRALYGDAASLVTGRVPGGFEAVIRLPSAALAGATSTSA